MKIRISLSAKTVDVAEKIFELIAELKIVVNLIATAYPKDDSILGSSLLSTRQVYLYIPTIKRAAKFSGVPYATGKQWVLLHEIMHIKHKIRSNQTPWDEMVVDKYVKKIDPTYKTLALPTFRNKQAVRDWAKTSPNNS